MLDTIFWASVVLACLGGILMIGIDLYDEWAEEAQRINSEIDDVASA